MGKLTTKLGALALSAALAAGLGALPNPAAAQRVLAARVNGAPIGLDLLNRQYEELLREKRLHMARMQDPAKAKALKREALDNLIRVELLWQEARSAGLSASDAEVDKSLADMRKGFRTEDAFQRRLENTGFDEKSFREHLRKLISGDRYAQRVVEREVKVSDKDIEDFYAINPRLFKQPERAKARQIVVAVPRDAGADAKAQARAKAQGLLARARAGEDFETLARQHSDDVTRQWGGELDPFGRGELAKPLEDAAFALVPGATSDLVETAAGLHIVKLEALTPAVVVPLDQARDRIREYLTQTRGKEAIDKEVEQLRALGKVELLTPL